MPIYPYEIVDILIDIPDKIINDTIIKRKIQLFTMTYNQKSKYLVLNWTIRHYAHNDGEYGEYLGTLIPDKSRESIADNETIVNVQTGEFLFPNEEGDYDENVYRIGQYDFFNLVAETQNINVHNMIRQYATSLNWN